MAIIAVLAGIGVSAARQARTRSLVANDVSQLRQLGIAAEIYASDYDLTQGQRRRLHPEQLIADRRVSTALLVSKLDPSTMGYGNVRRALFGLRDPVPFKLSYLVFSDTVESRPEVFYEGRAAGWLVAMSRSTRAMEKDGQVSPLAAGEFVGNFNRLLDDTSVLPRRFLWQWRRIDGVERYSHCVDAIFFDYVCTSE